ncbi:MAG: universal stress protein, partial [Deltaproteobacteria bacterium]|nr:universal stress protein [Deltaproteobacteria bacterium]
NKPRIIGALIDSSTSNNMLSEVKKQALIRAADVTLVHVIEEESDTHTTRYGVTVEGEQLMAELERSVQNLRRFSIDPTIRLIRGEVVDVLQNLARELEAEFLVLGTSRKKKSLLRGVSVQRRLEKRKGCSCQIVVATEEEFSPADDLKDLQPQQLTEQQLLSCDIFFVDLWFEYLHYHTDFIYRLLLYPEQENDPGEEHCRFGRFLVSIEASGNWPRLTSMLSSIYRQFRELTTKMAKLEPHDHAALQNLYIHESLPLSCQLKKELGQASRMLRSQLDYNLPSVPFLADAACPIAIPDLASYGPVLRAFNLDQDLCGLIEKNTNSSLPSNSNGED